MDGDGLPRLYLLVMRTAARIAFALSWVAMAISHALGWRLVRDEIRAWAFDSELSACENTSIDTRTQEV